MRLLKVILLCCVVVAAHTHCVVAHAAEGLRSHSNEQAPVDPPIESSCENESSCICKGALLAAVVPPLMLDELNVLEVVSPLTSFWQPVEEVVPAHSILDLRSVLPASYLSALAVCADLERFLL